MKKYFSFLIAFILLILIAIVVYVFYAARDRHPKYALDLRLPSEGEPRSPLHVGLAKAVITPQLPDTWVDVDSNAAYEPDKGDTFVDGNNNGQFDVFWLAGFGNKRAANGVHDDIWARVIVWEDGATCVALASLDAIGLFHDDVITLRRMVQEQCPDIDHVIVTATHCHEVPDLMGMWGESEFKSGVNKEYLTYVQEQTARAIGQAYANRQPAILKIAQIDSVEKDLIEDSRPPWVYDDGIRMMRIEHAQTGDYLGILLNYGCHPETLGSRNLLITADYLHYWLDGLERGIFYGDENKRAGVGGLAIFVQGAVGGLMTAMGCETYDPWLGKTFGAREHTFAKARAQGYRLADKVLDRIADDDWQAIEQPELTLRAKTFEFRLQNKTFLLGSIVGIFDRGFRRLKYIHSEVNLLTIGPAWMITMPGEINPELLNGGIEAPEGRDYIIEPVEVPPIRQLMRGDMNFAIGLANDEVGYIMPKTHWDVEPPFTYSAKEAMYGEVNSLGAEAGPEFYAQVKALLQD